MATNKHHRYQYAGPDTGWVKVPTRAGTRRQKRRVELIELFTTARRNSPVAEAFQMATRMLGTKPADRRWLWGRLRKAGMVA